MKDYSVNFVDSRKFILSYKIENEKIIVELESGDSFQIPYSKENENRIIYTMEEQVRLAKPEPIKQFDIVFSLAYPFILLPHAVINFIHSGELRYIFLIAISTCGTILFPAKIIAKKIRNHYIKKLNYFLDHKKELNEGIKKSEFVKLDISKKAMKEIESQKSKNKEPFNINNIDNYTLKDLKTLKENIEAISSLGFDELNKEDYPVLRRKINN